MGEFYPRTLLVPNPPYKLRAVWRSSSRPCTGPALSAAERRVADSVGTPLHDLCKRRLSFPLCRRKTPCRSRLHAQPCKLAASHKFASVWGVSGVRTRKPAALRSDSALDDPIPAQPVRPNSALPAANSARMINLGAFVFIIGGTRLVEIARPNDQKKNQTRLWDFGPTSEGPYSRSSPAARPSSRSP
jgi:hypothetical protein